LLERPDDVRLEVHFHGVFEDFQKICQAGDVIARRKRQDPLVGRQEVAPVAPERERERRRGRGKGKERERERKEGRRAKK
jgi:hypothetical protein